MDFEDELLKDAEDDRLTVEFIQTRLPQEVKEKFTEENLYYFLDVLCEYYADMLSHSWVNDDEEIDIDVDAVAEYLAKQAKKDKVGTFLPEDLRWVVDAELDYGDSQEEE